MAGVELNMIVLPVYRCCGVCELCETIIQTDRSLLLVCRMYIPAMQNSRARLSALAGAYNTHCCSTGDSWLSVLYAPALATDCAASIAIRLLFCNGHDRVRLICVGDGLRAI